MIGPRIICNRPKESQSEYSVEYLKQLLDAALQVMSNIGRLHDFVSLLEAIGKGLLSNNVAIHLCLDIGALRRVKALSTMSYPKISMDWWLTVKIVLKGKALELFRGYMGAGLGLAATDIDFEQKYLEPYKLGL